MANPYYQPYTAYQSNFAPSYQPTTYQQPTNGLVKVNGYESALQYPLPPNSTSPVLLHASEDTFFIKRTDASGVGTVEQYDFVPHVQTSAQPVAAVSREEFDQLSTRVDKLMKELMDGE